MPSPLSNWCYFDTAEPRFFVGLGDLGVARCLVRNSVIWPSRIIIGMFFSHTSIIDWQVFDQYFLPTLVLFTLYMPCKFTKKGRANHPPPFFLVIASITIPALKVPSPMLPQFQEPARFQFRSTSIQTRFGRLFQHPKCLSLH